MVNTLGQQAYICWFVHTLLFVNGISL